MFGFDDVLSLAGPVLGGILSSGSAESAANTQAGAATQAAQLNAKATQDSIAEQRRQFDLNRGDILAAISRMAPYQAAGSGAVMKLADLLGISGGTKYGNAAASVLKNASAPIDANSLTSMVNGRLTFNPAYLSDKTYYDAWQDIFGGPGQGDSSTWSPADLNSAILSRLPKGHLQKLAGSSGSGVAEPFTLPEAGPDTGSLLKNFTLDDFEADPGYAFRLGEGEKAVERAARARGTYYSPMTVKELLRYNTGLASDEFGNAYARDNTNKARTFNFLSGLAGTGQTAEGAAGGLAGTNASLGSGTAATIGSLISGNANATGNLLTGAANARGAAAIAGGNAIGGGINSAVNNYQQSQLLKRLLAGGTGVSSTWQSGDDWY